MAASFNETRDVPENVWISDWEIQCCGHPFAVGDEVEWNLSEFVGVDFVTSILGAAVEGRTTYYDNHAYEADEPPQVRRVRVRGINALYCRYELVGQMHVPIAGSGVLEPRETADGWEAESPPAQFVGYLVTVDAAP